MNPIHASQSQDVPSLRPVLMGVPAAAGASLMPVSPKPLEHFHVGEDFAPNVAMMPCASTTMLRIARRQTALLGHLAASEGSRWDRWLIWRKIKLDVQWLRAALTDLGVCPTELPPTKDAYALQALSLAQCRQAWKEDLLIWAENHPLDTEERS